MNECPECNSKDVRVAIHTDYKECNKCFHFWEESDKTKERSENRQSIYTDVDGGVFTIEVIDTEYGKIPVRKYLHRQTTPKRDENTNSRVD